MAGRKAAVRGKRSAVPRDEALQRLQEAFNVLKQTKQGAGQGLEDCAHAVGADDLMRHPSGDVRLWAAKCLAEVLRIFVPSPPVEKDRMHLVLELFLEQLALLTDPMGVTYTEAFGLLERLTEIRGFMLIFDCPEPEAIMSSLVSTCMASARGASRVKAATDAYGQLEHLLAPLLTNILGEADEIPARALSELLEELMHVKRSACAGLVRRVLGGLAQRSAALPVNDYLNKALFADGMEPKPGDKTGYNMSQERLEGLLCATYELYSIQPSLVARVLPNLQADLQNANPDRRRATTAVIGQILAHPGEAPMASLVGRFQERLGDADDGVRMTALEGTGAILHSAASNESVLGTAEVVREKMADRCLDPNDAIRLRAVEIVTEVALGSEQGLILTLPILPDACRRILDKKPRVREACAEASAQIYAKHVLPRWIEGKYKEAQELIWIPQLLCEAYAAFCSSRLGYVAQLEEHIEQHVLGCGAQLSEAQRALAMLGFYSSAAQGGEAAQHGLSVLFAKKRDAHSVLHHFVKTRVSKASPLAADALALVPQAEPQLEVLEQLAKLSPSMDDKYSRPEVILAHVRSLDAVRDKALWKQLAQLLDPLAIESTGKLAHSLQELDRLLRVHRLGELAPLVRRALLSTWLLPDQVAELLNIWKGRGLQETPSVELVQAARTTIANLSKSFPGAFMVFAGELAKQLPDSAAEDAKVILQTLAAVAKRVHLHEPTFDSHHLDPNGLSKTLLEALSLTEESLTARSSLCRKVAKVLLLIGDSRDLVCKELMAWAEENKSSAIALQLAAAILEWSKRHPGDFPDIPCSPWLIEARRVLATANSGDQKASQLQCAAAELMAVAGSTEDVAEVLLAPSRASEALALPAKDGAWPWFDPLPVHAACATLRALRIGCVQLSSKLLENLAGSFVGAMAASRPTIDVEDLLQSLLSMKRSSLASKLKPAERLRLCTALPTVFALAPVKKQREAAQRMLQGCLKAAWQGSQMDLLDFAVACFVHFLSRLDIFKQEVAEKVSAFPESGKVAGFFCDALLRSEPQHSAELLGVALRVCDRVRYFVDREEPSSDAVHRAGSVLRYVAEKRCPELGLQGPALLQGAARGSMPAQLFAVRAVAQLPDRPQGIAIEQAAAAGVHESPEKGAEAGAKVAAAQAQAAQALATPQRRLNFKQRSPAGPSPEEPSTGSGKRSVTGGSLAAVSVSQLKRARKSK